MQDRQRYHIIIDQLENVPAMREQLEQSSFTDIKIWKNFPLLISASLTDVQADWLKKHPFVLQMERNNATFLHEGVIHQYELSTASKADADSAIQKIVANYDEPVSTFPEMPSSLFIKLDDTQREEFLQIATGIPEIIGMTVNENPIKEYSRVLDLQRYNWGIERVTHRSTNLYETISLTRTGRGVRAYIVDTGVLFKHEELKGRVVRGYDAFRNVGDPQYSEPSLEVKIEESQTITDDHGTHVASILAGSTVGIAPSATIVSVRAFSNFEESTTEQLINAVDWIISDYQTNPGPAVINMSLSILDSNQANVTIADTIIAAIIDAGLTVVVSAGNNSSDTFFTSPANAGAKRELVETSGKYYLNTVIDPNIKPIVVGATVSPHLTVDGNDAIWNQSNWGDLVDLFAPGSEIYGASLGVTTTGVNPNAVAVYGVKSGTSCSAPLVAGIAALHLEDEPTLTHQQVRTKLLAQATKNPFSYNQVVHDRSDAPRYTQVGQEIIEVHIENSKVFSPNRLAYAWHTLTHIEWPTQQYDYSVDENSRLEFSLSARSTDRYSDVELVDFSVTPAINAPTDYTTTQFMISYLTREYDYSVGNLQILKDSINFRINSPLVTQDITGRFVLSATDSRTTSYRGFTINTKNIPTPPHDLIAVESDITQLVHKGDRFDNVIASYNKNVTFRAIQDDNLPITYTITPTIRSLPPGVKLVNDPTTNTAYLQGTVSRVPYSMVPIVYEFIIRATSISPNGTPMICERLFSLTAEYLNEPHYFDPNWFSGLYEPEPDLHYLGAASLGNSYFKQIEVVNPDLDTLIYKIDFVPDLDPNLGFNGILPTGLGITQNGEIAGIIDPSAAIGSYYFRIIVSDESPSGNSIFADFFIQVAIGDDDVLQDSDQIVWITPAGNIGTIWETFASHVGVEARNPEGSPVSYSLSPNGGDLPEGFYVDPTYGYIIGLAPLVQIDTEYTFMIRARVGSRFVDREFSIIIKNQYTSASVMIFRANITGQDRLDISDWTVFNKILTNDILFRPTDVNFGAAREPSMYILSGTLLAEPSTIMQYLKDYHKRMYLQFGNLSWSPAYDPNGNYVYDVVYMNVVDPMDKAGGFAKTLIDGSSPPAYQSVEEDLTVHQENPYDSTLWNEQTKMSRYYPNSLKNVREDLVNTLPGHLGLGLDSQEGLPMWMRSKVDQTRNTIKGFTPAVIIAYVKPGNGQVAANTLLLKGFNQQFTGRQFILDRYFIANLITKESVTFDDPTRLQKTDQYGYYTVDKLDNNGNPILDVDGDPLFTRYFSFTTDQAIDLPNQTHATTFDDPSRLDPSDQYGFTPQQIIDLEDQPQPTRFDMKTFEIGKYYKFEDDAPILADRYANPDKFKPYG
jgi:subtilisin family serine protease